MTPAMDINEIEIAATADTLFDTAAIAQLRAIFRCLPGRAVLVDRNLVYQMVNQDYLDFVGRKAGEVLGKNVAEVLGEEVAVSYVGLVEHIMSGNVFRWEGWADYGALGKRYIQEAISPYQLDDNGEVLGAIAVAKDLTEMKLYELELVEKNKQEAQSKALNDAIINNSLDSIVVIDETGTVIDFNPSAQQLFGYSREEAVGAEIGNLIIPEKYRERHRSGMTRYMETGASRIIGRRLELEAMRKDGLSVPIELAISDVSVNEKRLFTAHIRDLTDAKAAQIEIERQREALYQKEKLAALGSLLSGVAHELNNPLSIVIGQAMMLREKASREGATDDIADRTQRIENAANRCARIVKTFLAMARQRKAERSYVHIDTIIRDAVELLNYSLRTTDVKLEVGLAQQLPETFADADLLHQVLVNLIVNARQALEESEIKDRRIEVKAFHDDIRNAIVIHVSDNGPGIPAAIRGRIFDPFFTTKPQDHGTGIGLAVSRGLIEAHNGTLELAVPQPARGARFVITLPVMEKDEDSEQSFSLDTPPVRGDTVSRVLVVDDEPELAELIADIVAGFGFVADRAPSGHSAEQMLAKADAGYAAILCDIRMPDGDGPGLYDWLSANKPEMISRIGFVTGDTLGPAAGRFLARTGCPVIEKPFTPNDIERVLASLLTPGSD